jgi:hypothetical protein
VRQALQVARNGGLLQGLRLVRALQEPAIAGDIRYAG